MLANIAIGRRPWLTLAVVVIVSTLFYQTWKNAPAFSTRWKPETKSGLNPADAATAAAAATATAAASPAKTTTPSSNTIPSAVLSNSSRHPAFSSLERVLVVARLKSEDVSWISAELPDVQAAVYVVDDPDTDRGFRVPTNKGHEAMVYLTYVIDHYDSLPTISVFAHAHRSAWHNNDLLDSSMPMAVRRLQTDFVQDQGYMNLRCHVQPGCIDNLHLDATVEDGNKPEVTVFRDIWDQLYPDTPLPETLSAPCCAQFAVSRERIRSVPRARFIKWRDWLLTTDLKDNISGRIFEYTWQLIFSGKTDLCPTSHHCYCGGFAVCFASAAANDAWFALRETLRDLEKEERDEDDKKDGAASKDKGKKKDRAAKMADIRTTLDAQKAEALKRGLDPEQRRKALTS